MEKIDKATRAQYRKQVEEDFPENMNVGDMKFRKKLSMRYGENPGYPAAFYQEEGASGPNMATLEVLQQGSKGLGYINVGDMDLGQRLARKLTDIYPEKNICVLIKHEMPSGVALGEDLRKSSERHGNAIRSPTSAVSMCLTLPWTRSWPERSWSRGEMSKLFMPRILILLPWRYLPVENL